MANSKLYFGGIPTEIDIRKLREAYPDGSLTVGRIINYTEVEALLRMKRTDNRWRTVTHRWRRLVEKESGVIVGTVDGEAFKVLDDHETLDTACGKLRTSVRCARRSLVLNTYVDRKKLTAEEGKRHDFLSARGAAIMAATQLRGRGAELPKLG